MQRIGNPRDFVKSSIADKHFKSLSILKHRCIFSLQEIEDFHCSLKDKSMFKSEMLVQFLQDVKDSRMCYPTSIISINTYSVALVKSW